MLTLCGTYQTQKLRDFHNTCISKRHFKMLLLALSLCMTVYVYQTHSSSFCIQIPLSSLCLESHSSPCHRMSVQPSCSFLIFSYVFTLISNVLLPLFKRHTATYIYCSIILCEVSHLRDSIMLIHLQLCLCHYHLPA